MPTTVECFFPGKGFPAISVTGTRCALNCKHCGRRYLDGMVPATSPEELEELASELSTRGAKGFLLSGGCDRRGKVPVGPFAPAIRRIKESTKLLVNCHVGLSDQRELSALISSGVDAFSADVYGSDGTIKEVLGIDRTAEEYVSVLRALRDMGARVAPHLCIGIHSGELKGELKAIESMARLEPEALIIISLIPTKGSDYELVPAPSHSSVLSIVRAARAALPDTKLLLGCMRSKKDRTGEMELVKAGLDGIVMPSGQTVATLESSGFRTISRPLCCAFAGVHL